MIAALLRILLVTAALAITSAAVSAQGTKLLSYQETIDRYFISVPLKTSKNGIFYTEVSIGGKPEWMAIDTGADGIIFTNAIAEKYGITLTRQIRGAQGAGGKKSNVYKGFVKNFKIGTELVMGSREHFFIDMSHSVPFEMGGKDLSSAGQLGITFYNSTKASIDYFNQRLFIPKTRIEGGLSGLLDQVGYETVPMVSEGSKRRYIEARLNGEKVYFFSDTGASSLVMFSSAIRKYKIPARESRITANTIADQIKNVKVASVTNLQLGPRNLSGPLDAVIVNRAEVQMVNGHPVVGMMGAQIFKALNAVIDHGENKLMIKIGD